jgi:hypothetical protein
MNIEPGTNPNRARIGLLAAEGGIILSGKDLTFNPATETLLQPTLAELSDLRRLAKSDLYNDDGSPNESNVDISDSRKSIMEDLEAQNFNRF